VNQRESVSASEAGLGGGQQIEPGEVEQLRGLIKSENEKIRQLVQKVEKLKVVVKL